MIVSYWLVSCSVRQNNNLFKITAVVENHSDPIIELFRTLLNDDQNSVLHNVRDRIQRGEGGIILTITPE